MVKAGDEIMFAAEEDHDQMNWIYKLYTATGQSYKPALPTKMGGLSGMPGTDPSIQKVKGGQYFMSTNIEFCSGLYQLFQLNLKVAKL